MRQPPMLGRPPPHPHDEEEGAVDGLVEPARHRADLRVVGGPNGSPVRRPDLLMAIRQWHKGKRDRVTGIHQHWTTLVLIHADSGREIRQFDVRPDEDDVELAIEIEQVLDSHGQPLANKAGITQSYQLDAYFAADGAPPRIDPQANWMGDVKPSANLDGFGMGQGLMRSRGTPQDFEQQRFRARELEIGASFGLTRYNVEVLVGLLDKANTRIAALEAREDSIKERERQLKKEEYDAQLAMMREQAKIKRTNFIVAKAARYLPIIVSRFDQKLFGIAQLSPEEKNAKSTEIVKNLLSKLSDNQEGQAKLDQIITILDLKPEEVQQIKDVGVMMWLEEQRKNLEREAELAGKGGFAGLGDDVKELMSGLGPPKQMGQGSK